MGISKDSHQASFTYPSDCRRAIRKLNHIKKRCIPVAALVPQFYYTQSVIIFGHIVCTRRSVGAPLVSGNTVIGTRWATTYPSRVKLCPGNAFSVALRSSVKNMILNTTLIKKKVWTYEKTFKYISKKCVRNLFISHYDVNLCYFTIINKEIEPVLHNSSKRRATWRHSRSLTS